MQRYYIHVVDGGITYRDPEGSKASNLLEVEELAQNAAREMVAEALKAKRDCAPVLLVEDEQERKLFEISASCTLSTKWLV